MIFQIIVKIIPLEGTLMTDLNQPELNPPTSDQPITDQLEAHQPEISELHSEVLNILKALADANRLRIVGFLAQGQLTVEQLSANLGLSMSTTSHHLSRLAQAGLVESRSSGHYSLYTLLPKVIEKLTRQLLQHEKLPDLAPPVATDAPDRKILLTFLDNEGRITTFPTQRKKYLIVLRYVLEALELGTSYTERELNDLLRHFSEDTARLRRSLVDFGFMAREGGGGLYWRIPEA
jgi:predicted transcriptional regulator